MCLAQLTSRLAKRIEGNHYLALVVFTVLLFTGRLGYTHAVDLIINYNEVQPASAGPLGARKKC